MVPNLNSFLTISLTIFRYYLWIRLRRCIRLSSSSAFWWRQRVTGSVLWCRGILRIFRLVLIGNFWGRRRRRKSAGDFGWYRTICFWYNFAQKLPLQINLSVRPLSQLARWAPIAPHSTINSLSPLGSLSWKSVCLLVSWLVGWLGCFLLFL